MRDFDLMTLRLQKIAWAGYSFFVGTQTFLPRASSLGLIDYACAVALPDHATAGARLRSAADRCLIDLCCGCGALGIALFHRAGGAFSSLRLLDASPDAVRSADANLACHGVPGSVHLWQAGEPIEVEGAALAICNPPFLPMALAEDVPEWEKPCVSSPGEGLDVLHRCFLSCAGHGIPIVLKCLEAQLAPIAGLDGLRHRLAHHVAHEGGIAFSYWEAA